MNRTKSLLHVLLFSLITFSSLTFAEGLPLFWWKEGDFINFGDQISHVLVERMVGESVPFYNKSIRGQKQKQKLLASGSIYFFANEGDVVWGSGINGKRPFKHEYKFQNLDIRSVRGPLTRDFLRDTLNIEAPAIYGDPALLFPYFFPEFVKKENPEKDYLVIIHYLDAHLFKNVEDDHFVFATDPWDKVLEAILNSKFVITSSLHGIILAETYGIPCRLLRLTDKEPLFKFYDYYLGTGRNGFTYASSIEEALLMGSEPPLNCDLEPIYNAFPFDYWPHINFPKINFPRHNP